MSALESGAAFVNELQSLLRRNNPRLISNNEYDAMLTRTQRRFETRVKGLVKAANDQQRLLANDHPLSGLVPVFLGTVGGLEYDLAHLKKRVVGAISLRDFPQPKRPHLVPFTDELPTRPIRKMWTLKWLSIMITGYILFCSRELYNLSALRGIFDDVAGWRLQQTYVSFLMDQIRSTVMPSYSHLILEHDFNKAMAFVETRLILMSLLTIWTIEGYRLGHQRSIIRWPILFWVAYKMKGLGSATSLYFIFHMALGNSTIIGLPVPSSAAKAATLALFIVYIVATALLVVSNFKEQSIRISFDFLQSVPVYTGVLTALFTAYSRSNSIEGLKHSQSTLKEGASDKSAVVGMRNLDIVYLNRFYILLYVSLGTIHLGTVIFAAVQLKGHFSGILQSSDLPFLRSMPDASEGAYLQLIWDLIFTSASLFIFLLHTVWNLRGMGYISTLHAFKATMMVLVGQIIAGPGATYAALWHWRENLLSGLSEQYY
ncbi:hypothetical protein V2G26_013427 [Clonostachys chloroleuca]